MRWEMNRESVVYWIQFECAVDLHYMEYLYQDQRIFMVYSNGQMQDASGKWRWVSFCFYNGVDEDMEFKKI